jgi:hypothetical protein
MKEEFLSFLLIGNRKLFVSYLVSIYHTSHYHLPASFFLDLYFSILALSQLESRKNIHTLQLLKEQLARIWETNVNYIISTPTHLTPAMINHETTLIANISRKGVTCNH